MLGKLTASMRHMHCGFGSNNQGIIEDNRRKKRTTSRDTARGAAKASTSSEATEPICLRKDTRIVYESDTRTITRPLSRPAPFWNFRDSCNAARPSSKTSAVATSGNATAANATTRFRNAATSRTKADGFLQRFHRQPHHAAFLHILYSRITRYRPQAPIRFRVFGRLPFTACLLNASHPRKSHANAIIAIVLVAAFVVLAVGTVAAKNRQIKEHEAVTKQSKIVYDNAIQVTERTVISSMSILRLQVIPMCCPTCIFSLPSSMSYRIVRCSSHAELRNPSSQVTAMRV